MPADAHAPDDGRSEGDSKVPILSGVAYQSIVCDIVCYITKWWWWSLCILSGMWTRMYVCRIWQPSNPGTPAVRDAFDGLAPLAVTFSRLPAP
jgi:hypothetical protein